MLSLSTMFLLATTALFAMLCITFFLRAQTLQKKLLITIQQNPKRIEEEQQAYQKTQQQLHHALLESKRLAQEGRKLTLDFQELHEKKKFLEAEKQALEQEKMRLIHSSKEEIRKELEEKLFTKAQHTAHMRLEQWETTERIERNQNIQQTLITSLERLCIPVTQEITQTTLPLPSHDFKRKLVGKEGRNIQAFERLTGTTLILDQSPNSCSVSGFDPIRRAVAKKTLEKLFAQGRVFPTLIQNCVEQAQEETEQEMIRHAEQACAQLGIPKLHWELLKYLGALRYRYSQRQNVLQHSIEVAHLMELCAEELGLNAQLAKRIGLLHDIGKAIPCSQGLSHAQAGAQAAQKYGEPPLVVNGILAHHQENTSLSLEAKLLRVADAISASRPGARDPQANTHIQRLATVEEDLLQLEGVEKAFVLQAGQELVVAACPHKILDHQLPELAQTIKNRLKTHVFFPSSIKVTLTRQQKFVDYIS